MATDVQSPPSPAGGAEEALARAIFIDGPHAVRAARELARRALHEWRVEDMSDPVVLVVSELVTNALVHGHGRAWLEIRRNHAGIRVMVTDSTSPLPQARQLDPEAPSGRGLRLVQALTHSWGTEPSPCGKTVWAQVAK